MPPGPLYHRVTGLLVDLALLSAAFWAAFALRFDGAIPTYMLERAIVTLPYVVALQYATLSLFAVPRFAWRFVGIAEAQRIVAAVLASTSVLAALRVAAGLIVEERPWARHAAVPLGVILMDALLAVFGIAGARLLRRVLAERAAAAGRERPRVDARRTLLVGAGEAGLLVAKELRARPDLGIEPVAFLDDDAAKRGTLVHGLPVLGPVEELARVKVQLQVEQVLITIARAAGPAIRRIVAACDAAGLPAQIVPGIHELVAGRVLSRFRPVSIEDLLRREEVAFDEEGVAALVRGRAVLVTGAGGSIGSELCRQLCRFEPARLMLVDQAENPLFAIERELRDRARVEPRVADVTDAARLRQLLGEQRPSVLFHAAAHKHVALMEASPGEAIKNNVAGTRLLADLADELGVETFVLVSSDKAVNPTSIMGASKRLAELYVQAIARQSRTRFVAVRFGNVLASSGSVVPIFLEQIARGGPVTVTHPEATRFFMTIPEACRLVLQAAALGRSGEVCVLDMGQPVAILELARDLIRLSGLVPERDVAIQFTGLRPGEKLHEELLHDDETPDRTRHPKILVARGRPGSRASLGEAIERLVECADGPPDTLRAQLRELLPALGAAEPDRLPTPTGAGDARG